MAMLHPDRFWSRREFLKLVGRAGLLSAVPTLTRAAAALSSDTVPISRVYDLASSVLAQEIAQIDGVGQVNVGGGALPAVRVELNPTVLNKYGISLEQVRNVLAALELAPGFERAQSLLLQIRRAGGTE